jgi:ATPase subunit of ABC transporter with duplicated ATPase domains
VLEEVGTRVWHFTGQEIQDFQGTYEEFAATIA